MIFVANSHAKCCMVYGVFYKFCVFFSDSLNDVYVFWKMLQTHGFFLYPIVIFVETVCDFLGANESVVKYLLLNHFFIAANT